MKSALPRRILGYRIGVVDAHIEMAERESAALVSRARDDLRFALDEQAALTERLSERRNELSLYAGRSRFYEKAMQKALATADYLVETAKYRAETMVAEGEEYAGEQRLRLIELDREIAGARREIEMMRQGVKQLMESRSAVMQHARSSKVAGHILEASGRNAPFTATTSSGFLEVDVSIQAVRVVSQDGEEIGRVRSLVLDKTKDRVCGYEIEPQGPESPLKSPAIVPSSAVIAVKRDALLVHSSWVRELRRVPAPAEMESQVPSSETRSNPVEPRIGVDLLERIRATVPSVSPAAVPAIAGLAGGTSSPAASTQVVAAEPAPAPESEAVSQIGSRRMKYLVGRISGTDIRDPDGALIVAKGGTITAEIVDRARSAGKLAELIVNMTIPGLNPDGESTSDS
ncbi:MAG: PRC-barrel domain-containing protein [Ignavibacteriales bacterium]